METHACPWRSLRTLITRELQLSSPPPQTPHTEGPARSCTKKEKK